MTKNELLLRKQEIDRQIYLLQFEKKRINAELRKMRENLNITITINDDKRYSCKNVNVLLNYFSKYKNNNIIIYDRLGRKVINYNPQTDNYRNTRATIKELQIW